MDSSHLTNAQVLEYISELCEKKESFPNKVEELIREIGSLTTAELIHHLNAAGSIPEGYQHDSSEEKLYAKYCDFLVYEFFKALGMNSELCKERSDYADVIGKTKSYIVVADAKAFRLSRTALNPKDYKIEALDGWRKKAKGDFACLVAPINEFPKGKSRLYSEAVRYNVLLISYTHLVFILSTENFKKIDLSPLLNVKEIFKGKQDVAAGEYWKTIESVLLGITKKDLDSLMGLKVKAKELSLKNIDSEINYLQSISNSVKKMDENKVRELFLDRLGVTNKVGQILKKKKFLTNNNA